jgi:hypothetical protein
MLSIEWKAFLGNGLRSCYLGWVGYLDAVKKRKYRGWFFLYRGNSRYLRVMDGKGVSQSFLSPISLYFPPFPSLSLADPAFVP